MRFSFKKLSAFFAAVIFIYVFTAAAAAFSVDIDPNAEGDDAVHWNTEIVSDPDAELSLQNTSEKYMEVTDENGELIGYETLPDDPYGDEESVSSREPLSSGLCTPIDEYLFFEDEDFPGITDVSRIEASMKAFYKQTGVQPCLLLSRESYDDAEAAELLKERYAELFGEDGGHLLLLFSEPADTGYCETWNYPGDDAADIITYDAGEKLMGYISKCSDRGFSYEDTFCRSFELAADYAIFGEDGDILYRGNENDGYVPEYVTSATAVSEEEIIGGADKVIVDGSLSSLLLTAGMILVFGLCIFIIIAAAVKKNKQDRDRSEIGDRKSEKK